MSNNKTMYSPRQFFFAVLLGSLLGGLFVLAGIRISENRQVRNESIEQKQNRALNNLEFEPNEDMVVPDGLNFVKAAHRTTPAVVHITSNYVRRGASSNSIPDQLYNDFFGDGRDNRYHQQMPMQSSGSGVIISEDGYIVTNNHVVEDADEILVVLNDKRSYKGKVLGTDKSTDLALVKIEQDGLPFIKFGNSDNVQVGEWVLAVGNPFDLTSTVTAGIVSAKARNIQILQSQGNRMAIESFIQTDAAVNPGNSGGALVNLKGELIGVNTAIATRTGAYVGYSFAVPTSLVMKVVNDLMEYGEVQRALLGVVIMNVNAEVAKKEGLNIYSGAFVREVGPGSAADDAGIKRGDVIVGINGLPVNSVSELQELVARNRPGDKVEVSFIRSGEQMETNALLQNISGNTDIIQPAQTFIDRELGVELQIVPQDLANKLKIAGGLQVISLSEGKLRAETSIEKGFIITSIDKQPVISLNDIENLLDDRTGGLLIEGVYPDGRRAYFAIGW